MSNIKGELSKESFAFQSVTWKVPNFYVLTMENILSLDAGYFVESPRFLFADATWCLRMFPYVIKVGFMLGCTDIYLVRLVSSVVEHELSFDVGINKRSDKEDEVWQSQYCFNGDKEDYCGCTVSSLEIDQRRDELVPGDTLTVYCQMRLKESSGEGMSKTELGENSSIISEESVRKAEEQEKSRTGAWKLQSDLKKLLQGGEESDVCLVVSGTEFRAHRCILRARSPVFNAMFNHDTEETKSGKVNIDDLDPNSFPHFLEHMYTGHVEVFSDKNAFVLYTAADKYDVQALKSDCVEYMRRTLSVDSFCDVMSLALRYQEKELMELAVEFFKKNLTKILLTVKWQLFLSDNSTKANELLIKALVPGENQQ